MSRLCPTHAHLRCPVCRTPDSGALGAAAKAGSAIAALGAVLIASTCLIGLAAWAVKSLAALL